MDWWRQVSKQPRLLSNSSGSMCHVRQNKLGSAVSHKDQQKYLVTKGQGLLKEDLFFLLLLPKKHSKEPIQYQVGGKGPTNSGPACPNTWLCCSTGVSIVPPAMLDHPVIKGAKYCTAYYYYTHYGTPKYHCSEAGAWVWPDSLEGLFPGGQSTSWSHSVLKIPRILRI